MTHGSIRLYYAEFEIAFAAIGCRLPNGLDDLFEVFRMHGIQKAVVGSVEFVDPESVERFRRSRPEYFAGLHVPVPSAHSARLQSLAEPLLAFPEVLFREASRGNVCACPDGLPLSLSDG